MKTSLSLLFVQPLGMYASHLGNVLHPRFHVTTRTSETPISLCLKQIYCFLLIIGLRIRTKPRIYLKALLI